MSITRRSSWANACPFFLESDIISLSKQLDYRQTVLHDITTGAMHAIHPPGDIIISSLVDGIAYGYLRVRTVQQHATDQQLSELLGFLNTLGGLVVIRSRWMHLLYRGLQVKSLFYAIHYPSLLYRQRFSLRSLFLGILQATRPILFAACIASALVAGTGLIPVTETIYVCLGSLLLFIGSMLAHELVHIFVIRRKKGVSVDILQANMRLGLLHTKLPYKLEILSALGGPFAGAIVAILAAQFLLVHSHTVPACLAFTIAFFHLCSLFPGYGDGISLVHALNHQKGEI